MNTKDIIKRLISLEKRLQGQKEDFTIIYADGEQNHVNAYDLLLCALYLAVEKDITVKDVSYIKCHKEDEKYLKIPLACLRDVAEIPLPEVIYYE